MFWCPGEPSGGCGGGRVPENAVPDSAGRGGRPGESVFPFPSFHISRFHSIHCVLSSSILFVFLTYHVFLFTSITFMDFQTSYFRSVGVLGSVSVQPVWGECGGGGEGEGESHLSHQEGATWSIM